MKTAAIGLNIPNIRLYDIFRKDLLLPDERAHDLVQAIDEVVKEGYEQNLKGVATKEFVKEEIRGVRDEFQGLRNEFHGLRNEFQGLKESVKTEINRVELKVEQTKSELTRSIFWTSLVQFLAIIGAVIGIINFMFRK